MIIDNKNRLSGSSDKTVATYLEKRLGTGLFNVVTGFFTVAGLEWLARTSPSRFNLILAKIAGLDDGVARFVNLIQGGHNLNSGFSVGPQAKLAIAFLSRDEVAVKTIDNAFCHAKAYLYKDGNADKSFYLTGSSNLTGSGIGLTPSANMELNIAADGETDKNYSELSDWFLRVWTTIAKEELLVKDGEAGALIKKSAKQYYIDLLSRIYRDYTPLEIYYKILFELFADEIENLALESGKLPTRFEDSEIYKTLFKYQQRGALSLINMLWKCNGAILADAVGLGKTFTALAVIKFYQEQGYTTVVFCPKKLEQNWKQYQYLAGSRFERDTFHYEVRFHTDLQDDRLESKYDKLKLSHINTLSKLLFVIDESHNLRNDKSSRYQFFVDHLLKSNPTADIKILELSATPINNKLTDVRNQFKLFVRGNDDGFNQENYDYIPSLDDLFGVAQKCVNEWLSRPDRTIKDLIAKLPPKFFNLTDKLIVARTRAMIEKSEGTSLGFPKKNTPQNIYLGLSSIGALASFEDIKKAMLESSLVAYMPAFYTNEKDVPVTKDERQRQFFLVKMMMMLFVKRLESSWYACKLTFENVLDAHRNALKKALAYQKFKADAAAGVEIPDDEESELEELSLGKKNPIKFSEITRLDAFIDALQEDIDKLESFYANLKAYESDLASGKRKDEKLEKLRELLREKRAAGLKVIVFTTYTDTARYLYSNLKDEFKTVASVSGNGAMSSFGAEKKFYDVLQRFSPQSKMFREFDWTDEYKKYFGVDSEKFDPMTLKWNVAFPQWRKMIAALAPVDARAEKCRQCLDNPIDVLIATDCISEGQNLQDAQTVINYDIHWNPVRIIQRLGRIDRIHSANAAVDCVNFWPAKDYDEYIKLYKRIEERLSTMTLAGAEIPQVEEGIDEKIKDNPILDANEQKLIRSLAKDCKLPDTDGTDDKSFGLHDLSLEDFRQELLEYLGGKRSELESMPNGAYSGFRAMDDLFVHVPESLVALVASPCRPEGVENHKYTRFKLLMRPTEDSARMESREFNRKEILGILSHFKNASRVVDRKIDAGDPETLTGLRDLLIGTMRTKEYAKEREQSLFNLFETGDFNPASKPLTEQGQTIEDSLEPDQWDLIAWEVISK